MGCVFTLELYDFPNRNVASETGAIVGFPPHPNRSSRTSILARVGVSLISEKQACSNAEEEIPEPDFEQVQAAARGQWNDLLSRVHVDTEGVEEETTILLYSSVSSHSNSSLDTES